MTVNVRSRVRCAIYTRKSSEEGLEQSFNSLQAQREACDAYIASQRHEGWHAITTPYDDGGFSGGNMNRPALKQLLADIAAGLIDTLSSTRSTGLHARSPTLPKLSRFSTRGA
jgi:site-specific DNA recombinase